MLDSHSWVQLPDGSHVEVTYESGSLLGPWISGGMIGRMPGSNAEASVITAARQTERGDLEVVSTGDRIPNTGLNSRPTSKTSVVGVEKFHMKRSCRA
jgi:hypothetical protein